ncbi:MAG: HEAT repeat domain-containing protein [Acidobacteriota bacterium]
MSHLRLVALVTLSCLLAACSKEPQAPADTPDASTPASTTQATNASSATPSEPGKPKKPEVPDNPERVQRVEELVDLLNNRAQRRTAREELQAMGKNCVPYLLQHSEDSRMTTRWEVANITGLLKDERATDVLVDYVVADENPHVRWRSQWAVAQLRNKSEALQQLRAHLGGNDEWRAWNAAVGLATLNDKSGADMILEKGLKITTGADADWRRWEAVKSVERLDDPRSAGALAAMIDDPNERVRREVALTLGKVKGAEVKGALLQMLGDDKEQVRWRAVKSLSRHKDADVVSALRELQKTETAEIVIEHLEKALGS